MRLNTNGQLQALSSAKRTGDRPEPSQALIPSSAPNVVPERPQSRNLRVRDLWGSSRLPPLPTRLRIPEPREGALRACARSRRLGPGRRAGAPGGRGGGSEKRGKEGPVGRLQGPALPAPRTFATAARAQCGVARRCARSSLPPPAPRIPRSQRGSGAECADGHTNRRPRGRLDPHLLGVLC